MDRRMAMGLIISDYFELLALHKTILEAKFSTEPNDDSISGSPLVADICNRVVDEIILIEQKRDNDSKERWTEWLKITNHMPVDNSEYDNADMQSMNMLTFWEAAIANAKKDERFFLVSPEEKMQLARCYLSPFICSDDEIGFFVNSVLE